MRLSDRFPGLMLWHTVAVLAAVFAAKALLYWAADWLALGPIYSALAGCGCMDSTVGPAAAVDEGLACSAALRLAAPEPVTTDCASRPRSRAM